MKQVRFIDKENDIIHGGILDDCGNILCGCCGGIIESTEIGKEEAHEILEVYDTWISLDDVILKGE